MLVIIVGLNVSWGGGTDFDMWGNVIIVLEEGCVIGTELIQV